MVMPVLRPYARRPAASPGQDAQHRAGVQALQGVGGPRPVREGQVAVGRAVVGEVAGDQQQGVAVQQAAQGGGGSRPQCRRPAAAPAEARCAAVRPGPAAAGRAAGSPPRARPGGPGRPPRRRVRAPARPRRPCPRAPGPGAWRRRRPPTGRCAPGARGGWAPGSPPGRAARPAGRRRGGRRWARSRRSRRGGPPPPGGGRPAAARRPAAAVRPRARPVRPGGRDTRNRPGRWVGRGATAASGLPADGRRPPNLRLVTGTR